MIKELGNARSILLIAVGALLIIPAGLSLIVMHIVASLMSSSQSIPMHIFLIGLIIIIVGFVCILYPKKYRIRFIVGAFTSFYLSATFFILYFTFILQLWRAEEVALVPKVEGGNLQGCAPFKMFGYTNYF